MHYVSTMGCSWVFFPCRAMSFFCSRTVCLERGGSLIARSFEGRKRKKTPILLSHTSLNSAQTLLRRDYAGFRTHHTNPKFPEFSKCLHIQNTRTCVDCLSTIIPDLFQSSWYCLVPSSSLSLLPVQLPLLYKSRLLNVPLSTDALYAVSASSFILD